MFAYDLSICSNDYCRETNLSKFGWTKSMCSWLLWVKNLWRVKRIWALSVLKYQEDLGERGLTVKSRMTAVSKILSLPTKTPECDHQNPQEMFPVAAYMLNPELGRQRKRSPGRKHWPAHLAEFVSSRTSERSWFKHQADGSWGKTS